MIKLPILEAHFQTPPPHPRADAEVLGIFQDVSSKHKKALSHQGPYEALIEKFRRNGCFTASHGTLSYLRFGGNDPVENVLFIGLGLPTEASEEKFRAAGGHAWQRLKQEKNKCVLIQADSFFGVKRLPANLSHSVLIRAFCEGLLLSAYEFNKYKSKGETSPSVSKIQILTHEKGLKQFLDKELPKLHALAEAVGVTRDWSNEPSNFGTPEYYAAEARKLAKQFGLRCTVLSEKEAQREKMGLFLGVGQGAEREGKIVVLEYNPPGTKNLKKGNPFKTIALIGKGITFDSGGISIKPSLKMEEMKHDMTGAATMMGAILLASRWQVPNRVIAVLAFTENMPDGNSIQPGNILKSRAGKTVEVINTDAEGRLILADAMDFAQDLKDTRGQKPDVLIDAATLTGAASIALGKHCCAILGNDDMLIETIRRAGEGCGERLWQLPLFDEYFEDLKSDYADMKNSANDSNGGTIRGAIFLKQFVRKGVLWAHLDIANTATHLGHLPYHPKKGASGAYVRTLAKFLADY